MTRMKRQPAPRLAIVVGVDFSPASRMALARATAIAEATGAELHVVHDAGKVPAALRRAFRLRARASSGELDAIADEPRRSGVRVRVSWTEVGTTKALVSVARAAGAALVVVGTRGRTLPDTLVGSTAERVAATAKVPVLLVRRPARTPYAEVVVAADRDADLGEVTSIVRLVAPGRPLKTVHAYEGPFETTLLFHGADAQSLARYRASVRKEAKRDLQAIVEAAGLEPRTLVLRHGDPRSVFQGTPDRALLVLQRGSSLLKHAVLGSVTRSIIALSRCDVLVCGAR